MYVAPETSVSARPIVSTFGWPGKNGDDEQVQTYLLRWNGPQHWEQLLMDGLKLCQDHKVVDELELKLKLGPSTVLKPSVAYKCNLLGAVI